MRDNAGKLTPSELVQMTRACFMQQCAHLSFRDMDSGKDYDLAKRRRRR